MSLKLWISLCIICTSVVNCYGEQLKIGGSLTGTSVGELLHNSNTRSALISIENHLDVPLRGGEAYLHWGHSKFPARSTINANTQEVLLYQKAWGAASGTSGVVAYKVDDPNEPFRFAIVFSVPHGYAFSDNWFGITAIGNGQSINKDFYNYLYSHHAWKSPSTTTKFGYAKNNDNLRLTSGPYVITATMSNQEQSLIHVHVEKPRQRPG